MRTRLFRRSELLSLWLLAGLPLVAGMGCDNVTAGQTAEDATPPKLNKIVLLDGNVGDGVDILNERMPVKCSHTQPCQAGQFGYPSPSCEYAKKEDAEGLCADPLQNRPVSVDANLIRIVFSKLLDPKLETITDNPKSPGKYLYKVADGLVALLDDASMDQGATVSYDNSGAPVETSDVSALPLGPALVMQGDELCPGGKYAVKIVGSKVVDRKGQKLVDAKNMAVPDTYAAPFTVAPDFTPVAITPDFTSAKDPAVLLPNQAIQIEWNARPGDGAKALTVAKLLADKCTEDKNCTKGIKKL